MHALLQMAGKRLVLDLRHVATAAGETASKVEDLEKSLVESLGPPSTSTSNSLDLVVVGSFAREEATTGSDFDYMILAHSLPDSPDIIQEFRRAADKARQEIQAPSPGRTGTFGGRLIPVAGLVEQIGLDADTNQSMTWRLLFLEESKSLYQKELHERVLALLVQRYLHDYVTPKQGVPRFLLNDVVRYWRTVAVDYQAKRWQEIVDPQGWGLRYLKLRISRKLAFAGTLISLFWPTLNGRQTSQEELISQFHLPPLARLAQVVEYLVSVGISGDTLDSLKSVFRIADDFLGALEDETFRAEAKQVNQPASAAQGSRYWNIRQQSFELQRGLEKIFFDSEDQLTRLSRKYLCF